MLGCCVSFCTAGGPLKRGVSSEACRRLWTPLVSVSCPLSSSLLTPVSFLLLERSVEAKTMVDGCWDVSAF